MGLGDSSVSDCKKAIIDSGTSLLAGLKDDIAAIANKLGAKSLMGKEWTVDCSKDLPDLSLTLGGQAFTLAKSDLILQQSGSTCILGLMGIDIPAPNGPLWILVMCSCASTTWSSTGARAVSASPPQPLRTLLSSEIDAATTF